MIPDPPDVATALDLLGLTMVPEDFEPLACQVAWTQPAAVAMSDTQSLAYRVVWEAVEERIDSRTRVDLRAHRLRHRNPLVWPSPLRLSERPCAPISCHLRQLNPWIFLYQHARIGPPAPPAPCSAPAPFGSWASSLRSSPRQSPSWLGSRRTTTPAPGPSPNWRPPCWVIEHMRGQAAYRQQRCATIRGGRDETART